MRKDKERLGKMKKDNERLGEMKDEEKLSERNRIDQNRSE